MEDFGISPIIGIIVTIIVTALLIRAGCSRHAAKRAGEVSGVVAEQIAEKAFNEKSSVNEKVFSTENISSKEAYNRAESRIEDYYNVLIAKDFSSMPDFYADPVERYFSKRNLYVDEIIKDLETTKRNVISENFSIQRNTFDIEKVNNDYHLDYEIDYERTGKNGRTKLYPLRMRVILNQNFKIKSIYEMNK